ncbi:hypothetical protein TorRG33x02_288890 [Trema orientale]|uniref:Uncharacterized protein n=1 Tax=Trema orientale TaxID=63057 RepID=A0A2P5CDZ4_TREOI|nr:hypothetical protein TorRG33x02_288890 [Trema orientale]
MVWRRDEICSFSSSSSAFYGFSAIEAPVARVLGSWQKSPLLTRGVSLNLNPWSFQQGQRLRLHSSPTSTLVSVISAEKALSDVFVGFADLVDGLQTRLVVLCIVYVTICKWCLGSARSRLYAMASNYKLVFLVQYCCKNFKLSSEHTIRCLVLAKLNTE